MGKVKVTLACSDYDHIRDFVGGEIPAEGIDLTYLKLPIEEIFFRFTKFREWDVSEMSYGKFVSMISQGDKTLTAIPVFPSRVFRQSAIYVRADSPLQSAEDLKGKRVGIPEWAQTACIYIRGWLVHQVGLKLQDISWFQSGVHEPGRVEKVALKLPEGVRLEPINDRSLTQLLLEGEIDALFSARPPLDAGLPESPIRRLYENYREVEKNYYQETQIFPIMHAVVLQQKLLEEHPWVAVNLFKGFEQARENSLARMRDMAASQVAIPWCPATVEEGEAFFGELWPYGMEPNRVTLEAFLQYAYEHGVCHRKVEVEELFPEQVQSFYKV